jgi:hypothetical protein
MIALKNNLAFFILLITILSAQSTLNAQPFKIDKCGHPDPNEIKTELENWGYGYWDLLEDLEIWNESPYVNIDSLGASVQNRALWQLTITSDETVIEPKKVVFIHARTHPNEVQAWWVTNEVINYLLSEDGFAQLLREHCVFYIVPMYNPDGVELQYPRENAHDIDIESNWNENPLEPEVAVLRSRFSQLMNSDTPVEVALNMHSAYACKRYFVYHDQTGTNYNYTQMEKAFIGDVRYYYEDGIEPWHYKITWTNGTPTQYPESWWWINHGASVLALTYEDMNCSEAGNYDDTAYALLNGISDFLGLTATTAFNEPDDQFTLLQNYPNPVALGANESSSTIIQYELEAAQKVKLSLFDANGRQIKIIDEGYKPAQTHKIFFNSAGLTSGTYFYILETEEGRQIRKMICTN